MDNNLAYSPRALSEKVDIGLTNIFAAIKNGNLRSKKFGRKRLILHDDAMAWLKSLPGS